MRMVCRSEPKLCGENYFGENRTPEVIVKPHLCGEGLSSKFLVKSQTVQPKVFLGINNIIVRTRFDSINFRFIKF